MQLGAMSLGLRRAIARRARQGPSHLKGHARQSQNGQDQQEDEDLREVCFEGVRYERAQRGSQSIRPNSIGLSQGCYE